MTGTQRSEGSRPPPPSRDGDGQLGELGQRGQRRRRTVLRLLLEILVLGAAAIFVILRLGKDIGDVGTAFNHFHWHWLLLGVVAEAGSIYCLSWLQQRLLHVGGVGAGVRNLLPVTMAANAVAQSLPAGSLFAEGYSFRQYQRLGAGWTLAGWAELSAGALEAYGLATVALVGSIVVGGSLRTELLPGLAFVWVGAGVASALFRRTTLLGRLISRVLLRAERFLPGRWCGRLSNAEQSVKQMACFRPAGPLWVKAWLVATCNWLFDSVVLVCGLLTVGGPVPWRAILLVYAATQLLVELPITPGGLGIVEGGLTELLTRFGVGITRATAGMLMYRALSYWMLLLVGWVAAGWLGIRHRRDDGRRTEEWPEGPAAGTGPGEQPKQVPAEEAAEGLAPA